MDLSHEMKTVLLGILTLLESAKGQDRVLADAISDQAIRFALDFRERVALLSIVDPDGEGTLCFMAIPCDPNRKDFGQPGRPDPTWKIPIGPVDRVH